MVGHALCKAVKIEQLAHAERLLHVLIRVHEGDAAPRRAELLVRKARLFEAVLLHMVRHGDDRAVGDLQVFGRDDDALLAQARHLPRKVPDVDDHAGTHHADHAFAQNARGQQVQNELAALVDDGVPRVVAALVAADDVVVLGQEVDHAPLALIAPVDADDTC